jgi:Zn-dependent protease
LVKLFSLIGTDVKLHWSLVIPFALSAMSLESFIVMFTIFAVVTLHEFGHILACKRYGIKCEAVVLSCIGGAAFLDKEPETAWSEFVVAVCGPLVNVALILLAIPLMNYVPKGTWMTFMIVNAFMVTFNMLPALPMDGGRVFRALMWPVIGRRPATLIAVAVSLSLCILGLEHAWHSSSVNLGLISLFIGAMAAFSLHEKKDEDLQYNVDVVAGRLESYLDTPVKRAQRGSQSVVATIVPTKSVQGNPEAA